MCWAYFVDILFIRCSVQPGTGRCPVECAEIEWLYCMWHVEYMEAIFIIFLQEILEFVKRRFNNTY